MLKYRDFTQLYSTGTLISQHAAAAHAAGGCAALAASPAAARLETESNNVTSHQQDHRDDQHHNASCCHTHTVDDRLMLREGRCRARTCPRCGKHYGHEVRRNLMTKAWMFHRPALLSLTVDRDGTTTGMGFASAQHAHTHITQQRAIARLMRHLGITRWVWVLEFQQKSGDGWPHWHLLIDLHGVDRQGLRGSVQRAWHLWRDTWRTGGLDLQLRQRFQQIEHAVQYITKYLTKYPERGFPAWVVQSSRIRFCGSSREVGAIVTAPRDPADPDDDDAAEKATKPRTEARPLVDRMAECGQRTLVFARSVNAHGEQRMHYITQLPGRVEDIRIVMMCSDRPDLLQGEDEQLEVVSADGTPCSIERTRWMLARDDLPALKRTIKNCDELASVRAERLRQYRADILMMWQRKLSKNCKYDYQKLVLGVEQRDECWRGVGPWIADQSSIMFSAVEGRIW